MGWRPEYPGEVPTLGFDVLAWIEDNLATPDRAEYEPLHFTREQQQFVINLYALERNTEGRWGRKYRRAVLSRPKGWGKSPVLAAIAIAEALAPVVFDGWDADGRPVGKPWGHVRSPLVQLAAVSEDQTKNAWTPLLEMIRESPYLYDEYPGLEPYETQVNLPKHGPEGRRSPGRIEFVTSAATSREGNRPVFAVLDQTEEWKPSNGGVRLAATMRRNIAKTGGTSIESPNAYEPGAQSVAEDSAEYWRRILDGSARDKGLLYDHREAPPGTDMADRESLLEGLRHVYGDSAEDAGGWVDLERLVADIWDPATDPSDARRFYLNQVTYASDSWIVPHEWSACEADDSSPIRDGDTVVLGFDGSKGRVSGKVADATGLIGCRVKDGRLFEIGVWEQPQGPAGAGWRVPEVEVNQAVENAFRRYNVVGFYADPPKWESWVSQWEAKYGPKLKVKATQTEPIKWWTNRPTAIAKALEQFETAIRAREVSFEPGSFRLTAHMLNARRRPSRSGMGIGKEHPDSARKIDSAMAATLAWDARVEAVSKGLTKPKSNQVKVY